MPHFSKLIIIIVVQCTKCMLFNSFSTRMWTRSSANCREAARNFRSICS